MPAISDKQKSQVRALYRKGHSARQIAAHFNVSLDAAYYALRRFQIKRRTSRENNALLFNNKPLSFHVKENLTRQEQELKALGVALYWGEGYKAEKSKGVDFANSDPKMIRVFLSFLRHICGVDEKRLRVYLYCHSQKEVPRLIRYWSNITLIPQTQFSKPYIAKKASIKGKGMPQGLIHIRYFDKKLLNLIRSWIQEYANQSCVGGRAVKYSGL